MLSDILAPLKNTLLIIFSGVREFCQSEVFRASCWKNEVVVMETALYGRMKIGRCVESDLGYIGCSSDVLNYADRYVMCQYVGKGEEFLTKSRNCL